MSDYGITTFSPDNKSDVYEISEWGCDLQIRSFGKAVQVSDNGEDWLTLFTCRDEAIAQVATRRLTVCIDKLAELVSPAAVDCELAISIDDAESVQLEARLSACSRDVDFQIQCRPQSPYSRRRLRQLQNYCDGMLKAYYALKRGTFQKAIDQLEADIRDAEVPDDRT